MDSQKNILIVSQAKVGATETFIKAHIDRLKGNIFHLYGYHLNYYENKISLREKYKPRLTFWNKLLNFLPYYIVFRLNQQKIEQFNDFYLVRRYLLENRISTVLAEYGTTGAFITPVCKDLDIPLIVHFHGNDASRYDLLDKFGAAYRKMFSYATYIIGVSQRMIKDLTDLGCPTSKLILNPYGPNPKYFDAKPKYDSNNIIAIGRQTFKKAPYLSILAFYGAWQTNQDLHLHFFGDGEIEEVSKNLVKSLKIEKNVHFHGIKTPDEIIQTVNNSFLFIQHSVIAANGDSEGTPVAILEAMAAGLPVIATKHAGIIDVVEHNVTGFLIDELDIWSMTDFILQVMQNRGSAMELGKEGKRKINNHYSIDKHIDKIQVLIETV